MSDDEFDRWFDGLDAELERVGVDETIEEALADPRPGKTVFVK